MTKVYGPDAEALLDSEAIPNLISEKLCNELNLKVKRRPVSTTVANGKQAGSIESVLEVSILFDHFHTSMDFRVMENPSFNVFTGSFALKALRGRLGSGLKQSTLYNGEKKATLLVKYAVIRRHTDYELKTDSHDFTSDSNVTPDENEYYKEELLLASAEYLNSLNKDVSTPGSAGGEPKDQTLHKKLAISKKHRNNASFHP